MTTAKREAVRTARVQSIVLPIHNADIPWELYNRIVAQPVGSIHRIPEKDRGYGQLIAIAEALVHSMP